MMGEARARAIADIEMRRESQGIELGETFDVGRELRESTTLRMTGGFSRVAITGNTLRTRESGFYIICPLDLSSVAPLRNRKPETDLERETSTR